MRNTYRNSLQISRSEQQAIEREREAGKLEQHSIGGFGRNRIKPDSSAMIVSFRYVTEEPFRFALETSREHNENNACVSTFSMKEYRSMACYLSQDNCSGFAIDHGEIKSLFSWKGLKRGSRLVAAAIAAGGNKLECFEGHLSEMYQAAGFKIVGRSKFNDEYKPEGWDEDLLGRPDYLQMQL